MSQYYMPTKIIMGSNCVYNDRHIYSELGKKALIVTGRRSAKLCGAEDDVIKALNEENIDYVVYNQVDPNPTVACVMEGARLGKEAKVDFLIVIGGGSPMDAGKAIAMTIGSDLIEENIFKRAYVSALPLIAIPTTAGTGSEVTPYAILTNDEMETKTSMSSPMIFPKYALLDEKYMMSLSVENTINTAIDALSHATEGIMCIKHTPVSDALGEKSISMILSVYPKMLMAKKQESLEPLTLEDRKTLLFASTYAGMVIAQTGTTVVHAMGYALTYNKGTDHGRANGLLLGNFMKFVELGEPERIKKILGAMNLNSCDEFIEKTADLLGEMDVMTHAELLAYSQKAANAKHINNSAVKPTYEDLKKVYEASMKII